MPWTVLEDPNAFNSETAPFRVEDKLLLRGLDYWNGLRADADIPSRAQFDPIDIVRLLPHVFFSRVEFDDETDRMTGGAFLVVGEAIRERLTVNIATKPFAETIGDPSKIEIWSSYEASYRAKRPVFLEQNYIGPDERIRGTRELFLPFSTTEPGVGFALVVLQFLSAQETLAKDVSGTLLGKLSRFAGAR